MLWLVCLAIQIQGPAAPLDGVNPLDNRSQLSPLEDVDMNPQQRDVTEV
jgi:hypothetical protein